METRKLAPADDGRYRVVRDAGDIPQAHPKVLRFWSYAQSCRRGGALPDRRNFDPIDIPDLLRHIWILEPVPGKNDLRYRLAGTSVVEALGIDPTGYALRALLSDRLARDPHYLDRYDDMVRTGEATWRYGPARHGINMEYQFVENLCVPFTLTGRGVEQIVSLSICTTVNGREY